MNKRFEDENFRLTDFQQEVAVVCLQCEKKAVAKVDYDTKKARLLCMHCGYNKETSTMLSAFGINTHFKTEASTYFKATLWYIAPFKTDLFWAYNEQHLLYLEKYINAKLREHKDRSHFTLLEKLPKFYHEAKNREALLKVIDQLKNKK